MKRLWPIALLACGRVATSDTLPGQPPSARPGPPPTTNVDTFAVHEFFLGETYRDLTLSPSAWKTYGYNLDGKLTTATSTDVCTPNPNAYDSELDGDDGIDNAFGHVFVPVIAGTGADVPTLSVTATQAIQAGDWTLQIQVAGLSDDPAQTSEGLVARVFSSGAYSPGNMPAFDESTSWPVLSSSLNDGQSIASGAAATFPDAYVVGGTFVSGPSPADLPLRLVFQGTPLDLVLHDPIVTFVHASRADAIDGTIAGVLDVQELLVALYAQASHISTSLCGSGFDGIARQIEAAADILVDGTNAPGVACTGISVGFGFKAKRIANPTAVTQVVPLNNLCSN